MRWSWQRLYNLAANVLIGAIMLAWVGVLCSTFRYANAPDLDEDDGGRQNDDIGYLHATKCDCARSAQDTGACIHDCSTSISVAGGLTFTFAKVLPHHWLHTSECSSPPVLVCVHAAHARV